MTGVTTFGDKEFQLFSDLIHQEFGIYLSSAKRQMLQAKLAQLMRQHNLECYSDLYKLLTGPNRQRYLIDLAAVITTNKTEFFREIAHFEFIQQNSAYILKQNRRILRRRELKAWSAGCSTGEEPYTLAMVLSESMPDEIRLRILATDISHRVLRKAQQGVYPFGIEHELNPYYLGKYFQRTEQGYQVIDQIRRLITFRSFNLKELFPLRDTVDIIFCRNVMIYFDQDGQEVLLKKFYDALSPGGLLFIGHSESLSHRKHSFRYVRPTLYMKPV